MTWFTIYDLREEWDFWLAIGGAILLIAFVAFLSVGVMRAFHAKHKAMKGTKPILGLVLGYGMLLLLLGGAVQAAVSNYRMRSDLNAGHFAEAEGLIADAHEEREGRGGKRMYFRIGDEWFRLPFQLRLDCFPRNGEQARVAYEVIANIVPQGPLAHAVLRMQLTRTCELPILR